MLNYKSLGAAMLALFMLAACGSVGDILGTGSPSNGTYNNELRGTVDSVDTSSRSVVLTNVSGLSNMLSSGSSGQSVRVYYDNQTAVSYQGQSYRPSDLERGDQVVVRVNQSNKQLVADSMEVTYNARTSGSTYPSGGYPTYPSDSQMSTVRGTVRYVDTSRRTIEIESPSWIAGFNRGTNAGNTIIVSYNSNATIDVQGQRYPVTGLERGDVVEVQLQNLGGTNYVAQNIYLIRDVNTR